MRGALVFAAVVTGVCVAASAAADSFAGFSSLEPVYLVNQNKVCSLLAVRAGAAVGPASCAPAAADRLAQLSFKAVAAQRGPKAMFSAVAEDRTLLVSRVGGAELVRWESLDPIARVVEIYADHEDRVAVAYQVRRLGRDSVEVIAFTLQRAGAKAEAPAGIEKEPSGAAASAAPGTPPGTDTATDPATERAVAKARKSKGKAATAAWQRVLGLAPQHAEALFRRAAAALVARDRTQTLAVLAALAASTDPDAIEWLVAARLDPAFAAIRADPEFRRSVGLDRKPVHPYEKAMGQGGVWEQAGTSCDAPTVALTLGRDRKFRLQLRSACEGSIHTSKFAGAWRVQGQGLALILPNRDADSDVVSCAFEPAGDEEALRCPLDQDLQIVVLPARR